MSNADDKDIVESFFDLYDKYLELQYAIELCRPYFDLPNGKGLVDDLLRIAMDYGLRGESLVNNHRELLSTPEVVARMGKGMCDLADKVASINWPEHIKISNSVMESEFTDYIMTRLITPGADIHVQGFDNREWTFFRGHSISDLVCRKIGSKEWNGAFVRWIDGKISQIAAYENDTPVFTIHVYEHGISEAIYNTPPVEIPLTNDEPTTNNNEESEITWGAVIAGALGGVLLSSLAIQSKKLKTKEQPAQLEHKIAR